MYSPSGVRYDMTRWTTVDMGGTSVVDALYVTKITDRNGNTATINYSGSYTQEITNITTSDGRSLSFTYADSGTVHPRITRISTDTGRAWTYSYTAVSGVLARYYLTQVTRPDSTSWNYSYNGFLNTSPGSYAMYRMTNPQGGYINYGYNFVYFDLAHRSTVIGSKSTSDGGSWSFNYTPGSIGTYDTTVVNTPTGAITYKHIGPNYSSVGGVWMVGLLMQKNIGSAQTETYTWDKQLISNQQNSRPGNFGNVYDIVTYAPIMTSKNITRDGTSYNTSYSNFDSYGNAQSVTESGPNGGNRTTSYTYYNNPNLWIINQVQNESYSAGSIYRGFDGNGNLTSQNVDGATTYYGRTGAGDIASQTDPRTKTSYFSSYLRGVPQSESHPEGVGISRQVDGAGNVVNETNGEYKTFYYSYDGLNRLTHITYPTGNATSISYTATAKSASRGSLSETTNYDGFGRVASVTLGGITTNYEYDVLGRRIFQSNPNGGSSGTDYQYDILDRVTRIANADNTSKYLSYSGATISIMDERGYTTSRTYRAYGDPGKQILMSISAPVSGADISIARNGRDLTTSVNQNGMTRYYGYNGQYFLTSIINPETGTTNYGRDANGNMISKSVGSSGTTNFTYDGLNRLTNISYPGSTPDVTKTYSRTNKLLSDNSSVASRSYGYDGNDNLTSETLGVDGISLTATYAYDGNDHLSAITYPRSNHVVNFSPDVLGRATQALPRVTNITYWPSGQINGITYASGATSTYGQNTRLWATSFTAQKSGTRYVDNSYSYDGDGNLTQISDTTDNHYNRTLGYDGVNRLTTANGSWGNGSFSYSGGGNITQRTLGASSLSYGYDGSNRLSSISGALSTSFTYDSYGNITSGYGRTFTYDDGPNLTCFNCAAAGKIVYAYDGSNMRVVTDKSGVKTYEFYAAGGKLLSAYTPSKGNRLVEYIHVGGKRVAQRMTDDLAATTTTLAVSPNPALQNQQVTMTATVTGVSNPLGSVAFNEGATLLGTAQIANGAAVFSASFSTAGMHTLNAVYAGNLTNSGSPSNAVTLTVNAINQTVTTTVLSAAPNPAAINQTVVLTAVVSGSSPSGNVSFYEGATLLGTAALSNGSASFSASFNTAATHTLKAVYAGDIYNKTSTSADLQEVIKSSTTTVLSAQPASPLTNQSVVLQASVTGSDPHGIVTFWEGANQLTLTSLGSVGNYSVASFMTSFNTPGTHNLRAEYAGDDWNMPSSGTLSLQVNAPPSSTTLTVSPANSEFGQAVTMTATVNGNNPSGTVQFMDGNGPLGTPQAVSGASASLTLTTLAAGTHSITAVYSGDNLNAGSTSNAVSEPVAQRATTTTLTMTPSTAAINQVVTWSAVVSGINTSGYVSFVDGATQLAGVTINSNGTAAYSSAFTTSGTHNLIAVYSGDVSNLGSTSSTVYETVTLMPTTLAWASGYPSPNPLDMKQSLNLMITLSGGVTQGVVTFRDGATVLGTANLVCSAGCTAQLLGVANWTPGTHTITADFPGDATYQPSTVSAQVLVRNKAAMIPILQLLLLDD